MYGYKTKMEHSSLVKITEKCSAHQNKILDLYKNMSPENMNYLITEVDRYKDCLKHLKLNY